MPNFFHINKALYMVGHDYEINLQSVSVLFL